MFFNYFRERFVYAINIYFSFLTMHPRTFYRNIFLYLHGGGHELEQFNCLLLYFLFTFLRHSSERGNRCRE